MKTIAHYRILDYTYGVARVGYRLRGLGVLLLLLIGTSGFGYANTLILGMPRVENDVYAFPVVFRGDNASIAALDFRFAYDPAVFRPAGVHAGVRAEQANKLVSGNVSLPGDFRVVIMGLNQGALENGEVAWVSLERIGDVAGAELRIDETSFATPDGEAVGGQGDALRLPGEKPEPDESEEGESPTSDPSEGEAPGEPGDPDTEASPPLSSSLSGLPEAMRATLEDGEEIDGWDALSENSADQEDRESAPSDDAPAGMAEWVAIPVTRAAAAEGEENRPEAMPTSATADTLAPDTSEPVTIESQDDLSLNTRDIVTSTPAEQEPAAPPAGLWIGLVFFAVLFGAMLIAFLRRYSG